MRREGEGGAGSKLVEKAKPDPYVELTPDQRYVAELKDLGRVKLAARAEIGGRVLGWLEWIDDSGESVEYPVLPLLVGLLDTRPDRVRMFSRRIRPRRSVATRRPTSTPLSRFFLQENLPCRKTCPETIVL